MEYGIVAPICKLAFLAHGRTATASGCFPGSRFDPRAAAAAIVVPAAPSASRHCRSDRWAGASQPIGRRPRSAGHRKARRFVAGAGGADRGPARVGWARHGRPMVVAGPASNRYGCGRRWPTIPAQAAAILGQLGGEADETLALAARDGRQGTCPTTPQGRAGAGASGGRLAAHALLCAGRRHADGAVAAAGPRRAGGLPGRRGCRDRQLGRRAGLAGVPVHRRAAPLCLAHAAARRSGAAANRAAGAVAADANALDRGAAAVRLSPLRWPSCARRCGLGPPNPSVRPPCWATSSVTK